MGRSNNVTQSVGGQEKENSKYKEFIKIKKL
jgi:hypothetical protein